jgi:hypothetical protein
MSIDSRSKASLFASSFAGTWQSGQLSTAPFAMGR